MVVILHLAFTDIMSGYKTDGVDLIEGCFPRRLAARAADSFSVALIRLSDWIDSQMQAQPRAPEH